MKKAIKTFNLMLLLAGLCSGAAFAASAPAPAAAQQQQNDVAQGVVLDATGMPLAGATVSVKGTGRGATTDANGRFSITGVKPGETIHVSYIGYAAQDVQWTGGAMDFVLNEDNTALQEAVVVGFGTQKKVNLTGAVSQVKMEDVLGDRPVTNAAAALQVPSPALRSAAAPALTAARA